MFRVYWTVVAHVEEGIVTVPGTKIISLIPKILLAFFFDRGCPRLKIFLERKDLTADNSKNKIFGEGSH